MRYRMLIEYDGTGFHGWQIQPQSPTIQECLETALETILRVRTSVTGSGRTDAGVHARGQVAHFDVSSPMDVHKLRNSLNGLLPKQIAVLVLEETRDDFHARYDAMARRYHYYVSTERHPLAANRSYVIRRRPDFEAMNGAARLMVGTYDCSAFCRTQSETKNRVCNIQEAVWVKETYKGDWLFRITADRFLHGMVRAIVGTLLEVGWGKRSKGELPAVIESRNRTKAGPAAPAHGLVLEQVTYRS